MYDLFEQLLQKRNVTAYQVAKATGISTGSLTDWKMGRSTPKNDKIQKIADYFGVPITYFYGSVSSDNIENKIDPLDVDNLSYEKLLTIYTRGKNNLTPEEKIRLAQIILADRNDQ